MCKQTVEILGCIVPSLPRKITVPCPFSLADIKLPVIEPSNDAHYKTFCEDYPSFPLFLKRTEKGAESWTFRNTFDPVKIGKDENKDVCLRREIRKTPTSSGNLIVAMAWETGRLDF